MKTTNLISVRFGQIITLVFATFLLRAEYNLDFDINGDNAYLSIVQVMDPSFASIPTEWCSDEVLILPETSDEGEVGIWTPSRTVDASNLGGTTITVTFTPSNAAFNVVTFDIDIVDPPYLGIDQVEPLMFCKTGEDIFVDLIDTLQLELSNIMTLQGDAQLFSFISSNSFNPSDFENEMRNLNLKNVPTGPYTFFVESAALNACDFEIKPFSLEIIEVFAGTDETLNICFGSQRFHNFNDLINNPDASQGTWEERDGSNSGLSLSIPSAMNLSATPIGVYTFDYIVQGDGACSGMVDTATLVVNIESNSEIALIDSEKILCSRSNPNTLNIDLNGIAPYTFTVQLSDDEGNLFPPSTFSTSNDRYTLELRVTSGLSRIEGDIIYVNETSEYYDLTPVSLIDAKSDQCFSEQLTGSSRISFQFEELDLFPSVCQGGSFFFEGQEFNANRTNGSVVVSGVCDTTYNISLSFDPPPVVSISEEICENDIIEIKGETFSRNRTSGSVTYTGGSCDTIFEIDITLKDRTISNEIFQLCEGETIVIGSTTYDINNPSGTEILVATNGCDSIINVNIIEKPAIQNEVSNLNCEGLLEMVLCVGDTVEVGNQLFHMDMPTGTVTLTSASGCDSILDVNLIYSMPSTSEISENLCDGQQRVIGGETFDINNPSGTVILTNARGCDSIVTVDLKFGQTSMVQVTENICPGGSFDFGNGLVLDEFNTTFTVNLVTPSGCDSTVNYEVVVNQEYNQERNDILCEGEFLVIGGTTFDISNPTGIVGLSSVTGCDSVINVNLTFNTIVTNDINRSFCQDGEVTVGGTLFNQSNPSGQVTLTTAAGCDSVVNVSLSYGQAMSFDVNENICEGESYDFGNGVVLGGNNLFESRTFTSNSGCDSIVNFSVTINSPIYQEYNPVLCEGRTLEFLGNFYDENNTSATFNHTSAGGCDSTVVVNVEVIPNPEVNIDTILCLGEEIVIAGFSFTSNYSGTQKLFNQSFQGCDSIINIVVTFRERIPGPDFNATICPGEQIELEGKIFDEDNLSGFVIIENSTGCDTIINVDLTLSEEKTSTINETICAGSSININGVTYDESNLSGQTTLSAIDGCDSTIMVNLTVLPEITETINQSICSGSSIEINGVTYDENNLNGQTQLTTATGCDSTVTVNITIEEAISSNVDETICAGSSITINGVTYDESNLSGVTTLSTLDGCDSTVTVNVTVLPELTETINQSICSGSSIEINGVTYDENNLNGQTQLTTATGCDSTVTVNITIEEAISSNVDETICAGSSITINGVTYDESNLSGVTTLSTLDGCDSTVTVNVTVIPELTETINQSICSGSSIEINGVTYDENNLNGQTQLTTATGCDSTVTVNITIEEAISSNVDETICAGSSITINGVTYDESNLSGATTLSTLDGCDSTVTVNVTVLPELSETLNQSICSGSSIEINGVTYDENNLNGQTQLTTATGCDSTVTVNITIEEAISSNVDETICAGSSITINGVTYDESNLSGVTTLSTLDGCDSTVTVNVTVLPELTETINQSICSGSFIEINGVTYDENNLNGQTQLTTATGCDSTVTVNITIEEAISSNVDETICAGSSITINGVTYDESNLSGVTTLSTLDGCDSTVTVNVTVLPDITSNVNETICFGESVEVNGIIYDANNLNGQSVLSTINGCDSTVFVDITMRLEITSLRAETLCEGDFIDIGNQRFDAENTSGMVLYQSFTGCDSSVFVQVDIAQPYEFVRDTAICASEFGLGANSAQVISDTLNLISSQGCDSVWIVNMQLLESSTSIYTDILCANEVVSIGGETFDFNNSFGTVILTAANGCDSMVSVDLTYIAFVESSVSDILCENEEIFVNGVSYNASNPSGVETIALANGCDSVVVVDLVFNEISTVLYDNILCQDESISVNGITYDINTPRGTQNLIAANGCDSIIDIDLTFSIPETQKIIESLCYDEDYTIAGRTFDQSNPSGLITLQNAYGCDSIIDVDLSFVSLEADVRGLAVCPNDPSGGRIMINFIDQGMPPYSYTINGQNQTTVNEFPFEIPNIAEGQYQFEIFDAEGCSQERTITIQRPLRQDISIDYVKTGEGVYDLELLHTGDIDSFRWETLGELSCNDCRFPSLNINETTRVLAVVYDEFGCERTTEIVIEYQTRLLPDIANVINTSSTTGNNKLYLTLEDAENIIYDLIVFNRWGEIVFKGTGLTPNDPAMGWNGTRAGRRLNTGVYIYEMIVKENDAMIDVLYGDVTLID